MLNKKDFEDMRKEMAEFDASREDLIAKSREVVAISKKVIYSIHRKEMKEADKYVIEIKKKIKDIQKLTAESALEYSGSQKIAIQEFVEAICYYEYVKNGKIPAHSDLGLDAENYLLGICDLSGELVRNAINAVINGDISQALKVKDFVDELYWELSQFDLRNSELRRKYDGIKYDLKKLEDLAVQLKLRK
jgi:predicted translin family RNA/ssDNA-binding protein